VAVQSPVRPSTKRKPATHTKPEPQKENQSPCVWELKGECSGKIKEIGLFDNQMRVEICDFHFEHHMAILALHDAKWGPVDDILKLSRKDCIKLANKHGGLKVHF
jgi:hypothetical protein